MDECAFFRDQNYQVCDAEVFRAITPRILPGGMVVLASTPWAEAGLLFEEFTRNYEHPVTGLAVHAPTLLLRDDSHTQGMVERERLRDGDNARREFDAEFMPYGSALFFDGRAIERACSTEDAPPRTGGAESATIGADLGLVADSTAFVAVRCVDGIYTVTDVLDLRPRPGQPLRLSSVVHEGARFAARHGACGALVDHHVLEPAREHAPRGFTLQPVAGGASTKLERFVTVRNLLNEGRIRIPPEHLRLATQLREVISKPVSGAGVQIVLPRRGGVHGDVASAFVLAVWHAHQAARAGMPTARVGYERQLARQLDAFCPSRFASKLGGF
jgi:hypothetical protein